MNRIMSKKVYLQVIVFWPLTASITSEAKTNHAHVKTPIFLNKLIEIKFSLGWLDPNEDSVYQHNYQ
jgi:hypothetical protein